MAATRTWIKLVGIHLLVAVPHMLWAQVDGGTTSGLASVQFPESWQQDADLRDVFFINEDFGWAVGDRGTIWQTRNGGEIWKLQPTPISCNLSAVHFVDREHGWAVGGLSLPITHRSVGVVLRTSDGGKTWEQTRGLLLPWMTSVRFRDRLHGFAAGDATSLHPSGAFSTQDGGRTWSPILGATGQHWRAASFTQNAGLLVSRSGQAAWLRSSRLFETTRITPAALAASQPYCTLIDNNRGYVGSAGLPLLTSNGGNSWTPTSNLSVELASVVSLSTITAADDLIWLAGRPGTRIFRSPDRGGTWQPVGSGVTLPIHRLYALPAKGIWAVGARGSILVSRDGGVRWKTQRGGSKRAALLGVFADERDVPWDVLARASALDEYRVHIVLVSSHAAQEPSVCPLASRLSLAAAQIGASAEVLTELSLPDSRLHSSGTQTLKAWQAEDPDVMATLSSRLTGLVRTWRPEVVVTSQLSPYANPTGPQRVVGQLIAGAVDLAAADQAFPAHFHLGLSSWKTKRVLAVSPAPAPRKRPAAMDLFVPSRQMSLQQLAEESRDLILSEQPGDQAWTLTTIGKDVNQQLADVGKNPLGGASMQYASAGRRSRTIIDANAQGSASARRGLAQIKNTLFRGSKLTGRGGARLEHAERLLASVDPHEAGRLVFEMAQQEIADGDLKEADTILRWFVAKYDRHELSDAALRWLVTFHTSSEVAWQRSKRDGPIKDGVQLASAELPLRTIRSKGFSRKPNETTADTLGEGDAVADKGANAANVSPEEDNWEAGFRLAQQLKSKRPTLYAEPWIVFPLASISRLSQQPLAAQSLYRRQMGMAERSHWRQRAAAELAMLDGAASFANWPCSLIDAPPHLDGDLSDACWQDILPQTLLRPPTSSSDSKGGANVASLIHFAHDDEYLYLVARVPKQANLMYPPRRYPRPRDADLSERDRIEFCLDINRDYASWWKFAIDHRGWTHDCMLNDTSWNPKYYVAAASDDLSWTLEVAIPFNELAPAHLRSGAAWAIGVQRIAPGSHTEAWRAADGAVTSPDLQGVLRLE